MSNLPTIEYGRPEPKARTALSTWIVAIVAAVLLGYLALDIVAHIHRHPAPARLKCASNLRQIGQAMQLYAQDNRGCYPPDFQTTRLTQQVGAQVFVCRISAETPAPPNTLLSQPGHCSYVYLGTGLTTRCDPECIVAFEDPANHNLETTNFLFADGHVDWVNLPTTMYFLNELNAGHNPPRLRKTPLVSDSAAQQDYQRNWKARMTQLKSGPWILPATQPVSPK